MIDILKRLKNASRHALTSAVASKLEKDLEAALVTIARLQELSVTNIMIDVVPGFDGQGEEVYAKSVKDIEDLLTQMGQKIEDYELGIIAPGSAICWSAPDNLADAFVKDHVQNLTRHPSSIVRALARALIREEGEKLFGKEENK